MKPILGRFEPQIYAILRIIYGLLFMQHGAQKLFGWPGNPTPVPVASFMGLAGIIEFFGGLLIAVGLFTSAAAFICSGTMAVAYFRGHAKGGFFPVINQGELAVAFCFAFLYMSARGSGIWSLDNAFRRNKGRSEVTG